MFKPLVASLLLCNSEISAFTSRLFVLCPLSKLRCCIIYSGNHLNPLFTYTYLQCFCTPQRSLANLTSLFFFFIHSWCLLLMSRPKKGHITSSLFKTYVAVKLLLWGFIVVKQHGATSFVLFIHVMQLCTQPGTP